MKNTLFIPLFCIINLIFSPVFAKEIAKKDHRGFWVNAEEQAIKEATRTKKPLLIDFYGIWCPPCNQLDELVFSTKEFQKAAKKYVLLKMDADKEKSWVLKSKYNVGGYPTIILTYPDSATEIDRIIGYYPTDVIVNTMNEALVSEGGSSSDKIMRVIRKALQSSEDDKLTLKYLDAGLAIEPENLNLKLARVKLEPKMKGADQILSEVVSKRKEMPVDTLVKHFEIKPSKEIFDELLSRVNKNTLFIDNEGFTEADVYSMGINLAENQKNETQQKMYTEKTIESYEKLLKKYGNDSRSLNLSYTYYLQKNKDFKKAQDVYGRMTKKYPKEFTFYYQAAQMGLDMKDFALAKKYINQALEYAYGDNEIRSMDRLVKISMAETKTNPENKPHLQSTINRAEAFIKSSKSSEDLNVRTDRYLNRLAETLDSAKKLL